jgi:hypothetical protein
MPAPPTQTDLQAIFSSPVAEQILRHRTLMKNLWNQHASELAVILKGPAVLVTPVGPLPIRRKTR